MRQYQWYLLHVSPWKAWLTRLCACISVHTYHKHLEDLSLRSDRSDTLSNPVVSEVHNYCMQTYHAQTYHKHLKASQRKQTMSQQQVPKACGAGAIVLPPVSITAGKLFA